MGSDVKSLRDGETVTFKATGRGPARTDSEQSQGLVMRSSQG